MADALFNKGREGFLDGSIDADTAVLKVAGVHAYTYDATDKFMSDLGVTPVAVTAALASKVITDGILDAADTLFASATGSSIDALILYQSSAVTGGSDVANTAQRVIAYIDSYTGLPVTPNGGDIAIAFPNDANKIFKL